MKRFVVKLSKLHERTGVLEQETFDYISYALALFPWLTSDSSCGGYANQCIC